MAYLPLSTSSRGGEMVYGMDQFSPFLPLAGEEEAGAMCSLWHTLMNIFLVDSGKRKDFITKPGYSGRNYYMHIFVMHTLG